jgi:hypothetical protein
MGNAIPTTTTTDDGANLPESVDDGANLPESPKLSPRTVASFEALRRMARLNVMSDIENIIKEDIIKEDIIKEDKTKVINVNNIREAVENLVKQLSTKASTVNPPQITLDAGDGSLGEGASHQLVKKRDWKFGLGDDFEYDRKNLLRLIIDRIKLDQFKQFTTPKLTNDEVDKIKKGMMDIAEDIPQARALAAQLKINAEARERVKNIADGWTIDLKNPEGPLNSPHPPRHGGSKKKRRTGKKAKGKMRKNSRTIKKNGTKNIKQNQIQQ